MASLWRAAARLRFRVALAAGVAVLAPVFLIPGSAQAALSGTNWAAAKVPASFDFTDAPSSPVSCVPGTGFCVVVTLDDAITNPNFTIGQADLVTTNSGKHWKGFTDLPTAAMDVLSISCPTTTVCWAAGASNGSNSPQVAKSSDGGQTWKLATPAGWASGAVGWWNAIDCVSKSVCWVAGVGAGPTTTPAAAVTTDGGKTWRTMSNLPPVPVDPAGNTYGLTAVSCVSAISCVAVGGPNDGTGSPAIISTTDGGATWSISADPSLAVLDSLNSVDCLPAPAASSASAASPVCYAGGTTLLGPGQPGGAAEIKSDDGGATWGGGTQTFDVTGWVSSISCASARHCWAAGGGTTVALIGTSDGFQTWSAVTSDTSNEIGNVSCPTASFCVATTDDALWVTGNDGGL